MHNKDTFARLKSSHNGRKAYAFTSLTCIRDKAEKKGFFTASLSLSLVMALLFAPTLSFAKTIDKLGDYSNLHDHDNLDGSGDGYGGAYTLSNSFLNSIRGNYSNNSASSAGGAIYNTSSSRVDAIYGNFSGNTTSDANSIGGGAIYNTGSIGGIYGDFTNNKVGTSAGGSTGIYTFSASGGAIYNSSANGNKGYIGVISGIFTNNSSSATLNYSGGGAIYNNGGTIDSISGGFVGNSAGNASNSSTTQHYTGGGAIFNNSGTIKSINAYFNANKTTNSEAEGGAIYNYGIDANNIGYIGSITGSFTGNIGYNDGGAIFNTEYGIIDYINASFISNRDGSNVTQASGGAISNNGVINHIAGSFYSNNINVFNNSGGNNGYGGAIANYGTNAKIGSINANFTSNHLSVGSTNPGYGGAIYNANTSTIGNISGTFDKNYISSVSGAASGGAIYNGVNSNIGDISGVFQENYVLSTSTGSTYGGAIVNMASGSSSGTIGDIIAQFIGNYAKTDSANTYGGAIYNGGTIASIRGLFEGNYLSATNGTAQGGAIYNNNTEANIGNLNADFNNNTISVTSSSNISGLGGAIYNGANAQIASITGDFSNNGIKHTSTSTYTSNAQGGAIFNGANINGSIIGNFKNNYVNSGNYTSTSGGAIHNIGTISGSIHGDFINNSVTSSSNSLSSNSYISGGGAIYNSSSIGSISGNFIENKANVGSSYVSNNAYHGGGAIFLNNGSVGFISANFMRNTTNQYGGAILSKINLNLLADNATYQFTDNMAGSSYNAIHMTGTGNTKLNFTMKGTGGFIVNDSITGSTSNNTSYNGYYTLAIAGDNAIDNTIAINASVTGASTVDLSDATLRLGSYLHENGTTTKGSISSGGNMTFENANIVIDLFNHTNAVLTSSNGNISATNSILTLDKVLAGKSYLIASDDNSSNNWWTADEIKTTSLVNTSIFTGGEVGDSDYDSSYNAGTDFTVKTEINTDNEIFKSSFGKFALASVDGSITNGATQDFIQGLTHEDIDTVEALRLLEGGSRIGAAAGISSTTKTAMLASNNILSARYDLANTTTASTGRITQLASKGLVVQDKGSNIATWIMPMYAHESTDGLEAGALTTAYNTDLYGLTAGIDTSFEMPFLDLARLGLSLNFGFGSTDTTGDFKNISNDFKYHGIAAYASAKYNEKISIHADLGYTNTNSDLVYDIDIASYQPNGTKAEISSNALHLGTRAEYLAYSKNNVKISPYAGVEVLSLKTKDYDLQEDNVDANTIFNMETDRQNLLLIPVGAKISKTLEAQSNWLWFAQLTAGAKLSVGNNDETVTVKAQNVHDSFTTETFDLLSSDLGLALKAQKKNWLVGVDMHSQFSANRQNLGLSGEIEYTF